MRRCVLLVPLSAPSLRDCGLDREAYTTPYGVKLHTREDSVLYWSYIRFTSVFSPVLSPNGKTFERMMGAFLAAVPSDETCTDKNAQGHIS